VIQFTLEKVKLTSGCAHTFLYHSPQHTSSYAPPPFYHIHATPPTHFPIPLSSPFLSHVFHPHPPFHTHTHTHTHTHAVLAQVLAEDGEHITKEKLDAMIVACDAAPSQMNMETLFLQEPYCSMEHFESWIKTHTSLASFSKWLLEEEETGFKLKGDPDPPTFYQTLADRYQGKPVTTVQLFCMQFCILLYINLCTA